MTKTTMTMMRTRDVNVGNDDNDDGLDDRVDDEECVVGVSAARR